MIKVTREYLASLLYLAHNGPKNQVESVKFCQLINDGLEKIAEYDKKQEIKEIGLKYSQSKLFESPNL